MVDSPFALLVIVGLVPGWVYGRRRALRSPPSNNRSPLGELIDLVVVSAATMLLSLALWSLIPLPVLLRPEDLADGGAVVIGQPVAAALTVFVVVAAAAALAWVLAWALHRGHAEVDEGRGVWWHQFIGPSASDQRFLGVHLHDGRLLEGMHTGHTSNLNEEAPRDLVLARPIFATEPGGQRTRSQVDRVIVSEREIRFITVIDVRLDPMGRPPGTTVGDPAS